MTQTRPNKNQVETRYVRPIVLDWIRRFEAEHGRTENDAGVGARRTLAELSGFSERELYRLLEQYKREEIGARHPNGRKKERGLFIRWANVEKLLIAMDCEYLVHVPIKEGGLMEAYQDLLHLDEYPSLRPYFERIREALWLVPPGVENEEAVFEAEAAARELTKMVAAARRRERTSLVVADGR